MTAVLHDAEADTRALVDAAKEGDRDAFGALYTHYRPMVRAYIARRIRDLHLADDLTQDTFRRALMAIPRYEHRGSDFGAFLNTIARNIVLDHYKSLNSRAGVRPAGDDHYEDRVDGDRWVSPETCAIHASDTAALADALARLSDGQRECLELRFLRGLSVAETARVLGRNEGAVKALQSRATGALRRDPAMEALR